MQSYRNNTIIVHKNAIKIAGKGIPVFPCRANKSPYTPRGFKDATTVPGKVNAFWNKYRGAKIGMPTGKHSAIFVVDVDRLEALCELPGQMPETRTVRTAGGGLHFYFNHVDGLTNKRGALPNGIDVRGDGGYVILPPSEGYTIESRAPIADAPDWLLEALRDQPRKPSGPGRSGLSIPDNGEPIPDGRRNETLASIAGRLHDGTRDLSQLEEALLDINEARCLPPLPPEQVRKIAGSIYRYEPCRPLGRAAHPDVLAALSEIEETVWRRGWPGMGGKSERDLLIALIKAAGQHGSLMPAGVRVSISVRALALSASLSKRATEKGLGRLKEKGLIRRDGTGSGTQAGAFVLVRRAKVGHSPTEAACRSSVLPLRAPRLRWSAPEILRLGKTAGAVIDALETLGGRASPEEVARLLEVKRPRDLKRRVISRLEAAGVVECAGDSVSLAGDWLEALNRERETAGEIAALRRDMARYDRERIAYAKRHENKPERAPSHEELAAREDARHARRMRLTLEALRTPESGPALNLELMMDGELHNPEYLVRSVVHFYGAPPEQLESWRAPVLEAAAVLARERAPAPPPDWRSHPLDCSCAACLYPAPRYARPYRTRSA